MKKGTAKNCPNPLTDARVVEEASFSSAGVAPFAYVGPDATIPVSNLRLAPLNPNWSLVGSVSWNAKITYADHGRNDPPQTLSGSSAVWTPIPIDFQGIVQGGSIAMTVKAVVRDNHTGAQNDINWSGSSEIRGQNPTRDAIKARLGDIPTQVVGYLESNFRQFGSDSWPLVDAYGGFGVMQLTMDPVPTARQVWDWMQNVDAGKAKFEAGKGNVRQHYLNLRTAHPTLPALDDSKLWPAYYEYYNRGPNYYWVPNPTYDDWLKNPDPAYYTYGDKAVKTEALVRAGTPPADW